MDEEDQPEISVNPASESATSRLAVNRPNQADGESNRGLSPPSLATIGSDESARSTFQAHDFGSSYNRCDTDHEDSDEDCGYKHRPNGQQAELLIQNLESINDEKLPVQLRLQI